MNGIVTGKIEKTTGSMVFKSEYSQPIPENTIMSIYISDKNQFVRIVDKAGNIILMKVRNAPRGNEYDYDGALTLWHDNSNRFQTTIAFFRCNWDDEANASFVIQSNSSVETLRYYLTSVERGILEIA
nr:MAG TPA: hypothetical protein [Caudoviricetes sp.]